MMIDYIQQMWELAVDGKLKGIWFWSAVYAFLVCTYSVVYQLRIRNWVCIRGDLQKLGLSKFGHENVLSEQDYVAKARYSYTVDGKLYEGKRVSPWVMTASHNVRFILNLQLRGVQRIGEEQVKVFYNPANPRKSFLVLPSKVGIAFTFVISLLPAVAYWSRFYG